MKKKYVLTEKYTKYVGLRTGKAMVIVYAKVRQHGPLDTFQKVKDLAERIKVKLQKKGWHRCRTKGVALQRVYKRGDTRVELRFDVESFKVKDLA